MTDDGLGFAVFGTTAGACGLVWNEHGTVVGSFLPDDDALVRDRLRAWYPGAVQAEVPGSLTRAVEGVRTLLSEGSEEGLAHVPLDLSRVPPFDRRVYEVVREIPPGRTLTYGEVAGKVGEPGAAQAVGQAMGRNPFPPIVPCHRVIAAGRKVGGFSARGGARSKLRMLETEGVFLEPQALFEL